MTTRTSVPMIYVTGTSGALGGELARHLRQTHAVTAVPRGASLPDTGWYDPARPDAIIIHAAGRSGAMPEGDVEDETRLQLDLFTDLAARGWHGRLILLSSAAVYGEAKLLPTPEDAELKPVNAYGRYKLAVEQGLCVIAASAGAEVVALRLSNLYGTRRDLDRKRVIALLIDAALSREPFTTHGDGTSLRDYLHVADLCRAVEAALRAAPGVLNIASGTGVSLNDLIRRIEALSGQKLDRRRGSVRAEAASSVLDIRKAVESLDWAPEIGLDQGIARQIALMGGRPVGG